MHVQRVLWAGVLLGCQSPAIDSSSPESGAYGTVVTVQGENLDIAGGRIVFDDGTVVASASMLSVSDSTLTFRVPSPAMGDFRWIGDEEAVAGGRFQPDPWRPIALAQEGEGQARLDFAVLGPERVAELRSEDQQLVVLFHDGQAITRVSSANAGRPAAAVAWAESDELIGAFVLERQPEPVLRALEADTTEARDVSLELPEDATELLGFDRVDGRRYAFVADFDEAEVLKYEWTEAGLEEVMVVSDPVDQTSTERRFAARAGHAWRVWVQIQQTLFDQVFTVQAAYLSPETGEFQAPIEVGTGDDSASYFELLGVTDQGELALEFCGADSDIVASTVTHCQSVLVAVQGVLETSSSLKGEPRQAYLPLGSEIHTFECADDTQRLLTASDTTGDALLSPCADRLPRTRLSPTDEPGFLVKSAEGYVVLTRRP